MGKRIREYYISIDVEADGPCPGINSMLQFGAVFYDIEGNILEEYSVNIEQIEGGIEDSDTMKWWAEQETKNLGLWASMRSDLVPPKLAMQRFESIVQKYNKQLNAQPVVAAFPSGYDFSWLYYYLCKYLGQSVVGFSSLDMKTLAMALLKTGYRDASKKRWPADWRDSNLKHTHNALSDAKEQGYSLFKMLKELRF